MTDTTADTFTPAVSDERPSAYIEHGKLILRMSAFGTCPRALVAYAAGMDPQNAPDFLIKAGEKGTALEPVIRKRMNSHGVAIRVDRTKYSFPYLNTVLRGEVDGFVLCLDVTQLLENLHEYNGEVLTQKHGSTTSRAYAYYGEDLEAWNGEEVIWECKTMSADRFKLWTEHRFARFVKYAWQISGYMHGHKKAALYTVYNRDTQEMDIMYIPTPPMSLVQVIKRVRDIQGYWAGYGAGAPWPTCVTPEKGWCPFSYLHDDQVDKPAPVVLDMNPVAAVDYEKTGAVSMADIRAALKADSHQVHEARQEMTPGLRTSITEALAARIDLESLSVNDKARYRAVCRAYTTSKRVSTDMDKYSKSLQSEVRLLVDSAGAEVRIDEYRAYYQTTSYFDQAGFKMKHPELYEEFMRHSQALYIKGPSGDLPDRPAMLGESYVPPMPALPENTETDTEEKV